MSAPSISRKPVGHPLVGQVAGFPPPPQQFTLQGPPPVPMSSHPGHAPGQMMLPASQGVPVQPQTASYQPGTYFTPAPPTMARPTQVVQSQPVVAPATQQVAPHWPTPSATPTIITTPTYQSPVYTVAPPQTPSFAPPPTPAASVYQSQSPYPSMAQAAQARPPMNMVSSQNASRPGQVHSPTPSFHQHYPSATSITMPSPGLVASAPAPGQITNHPQHPGTANSMQSLANDFDRRMSLSSTPSVGTPMVSVPTPTPLQQQLARAADGSIRTCVSCKKGIPQNLSIFTCLICSTAAISTDLCVWCYTTGSSGPSHPHDISYFAADSDVRVQGQVGFISPQLWTVRKNASGRMWFTYNQTGFRTHIQPLTALVYAHEVESGLPPGWLQMKSPDGKVYYRNPSTNASSWTKPKYVMPEGWKVLKTPDGILFYVNETLQLSSWDRPGEQPKPKLAKQPSTGPTTPTGASQAGPVVRMNNQTRPSRLSLTANNIAMASSVANNVAKLSAASDMSPSGILTATVAATKLAGIGLKVAGKKIGKFGKSENVMAAANILGAASQFVGDGDDYGGGDFDLGGGVDVEEVVETQETEVTDMTEVAMVDETTYSVADYSVTDYSVGDYTVTETETVYAMPEQTYIQQDTYMAPQQEAFTEQQTSFIADQTTYVYDSNVGMPPGQFEQPLETVVTTNVDITVQENLVNETVQNDQYTETSVIVQENVVVQETQYTETTMYTESSQNIEVGQYVRQDAVITDFSDLSWADPPSFDNAEDTSTQPEPEEAEPKPEPQYIESQPELPPEVVQQPVQQPILQPVLQSIQQMIEQQPMEQPDQQPLQQPSQPSVQQPLQQPATPQPGQCPDPSLAGGSPQAAAGVQPLLLEPIPTAPLMVSPPAEQNNVSYAAPTYLI